MNIPATDTRKPKVIIRKGGKKANNSANNPTQKEVEAMASASAEESITGSASAITNDIGAQANAPESTPVTTSPPALPPIPGFSLEGMSRNQQYIIRNLLVFADCCVAHTEEEVFDVIARNYSDTASIYWWLYRIGKGDLVPRLKGKDLVDAARIVAHALHRQLKAEIGVRRARW